LDICLHTCYIVILFFPEKFYNRSEKYYKVVSSTNDRFNIYSAKLTDTGFEFGMTIKDEHKPTYPEEVKNDIFENLKLNF